MSYFGQEISGGGMNPAASIVPVTCAQGQPQQPFQLQLQPLRQYMAAAPPGRAALRRLNWHHDLQLFALMQLIVARIFG